MTKEDLYGYSIEKENAGGIYWQFLNLSNEDLKAMNIDIVHFSGIMRIIKNEELRARLKSKFIELVKGGSIYTLDELMKNARYTEDEKEEAFKTKLEEIFESSGNKTDQLEEIASKIAYVRDNEWKLDFIKRITKKLDEILNQRTNNAYDTISNTNNIRLSVIKKCRSEYEAKAFYDAWERYFSDYEKAIAKHFYDRSYLIDKTDNYTEEEVLIGIDPSMQIGTEIELNHKEFKSINIMLGQIGYEDWKGHYDSTVPDGYEFISPVFHDTYEEMIKLKALLEGLRESGYYADKSDEFNTNTSSQVNIGLDYLDSAESLLCFFELYGNAEDALYHICNPDGELIRQEIFSSSRFKPISPLIGEKIMPEDITREEVIKLFASTSDGGENTKMIHKKMSVCLRDAIDNYGSARLEFRMSNGSSDFEVWKQNIKLYAKLVEVSRAIADIRTKADITAEEEMKLLLFEQLKDEDNSLEDKLNILMDLLFDNEQDKQIYVERFEKLEEKIKLISNARYVPEHWQEGFKQADFQRIYRPKSYSIEYDPDTDEYIENDENDRNQEEL